MEHFNITLIDINAASASYGVRIIFNQSSTYGIHVFAQNVTLCDHQTYGIDTIVEHTSIHSIKLNRITINSPSGSFSFKGDAFQMNTNCFHQYRDEIKTPVHVSNSTFQNTRIDSNSFDIILSYPIYTSEQDIRFEFCNFTNINIDSATVTLYNVVIANSTSSGLVAYNSKIYIGGILNVVANNTGVNGGGMALHDRSLILFYPPTAIRFTDNTASNKGGAMYWEGYRSCANLMVIATYNYSNPQYYVEFTFEGNKANVAGDDVYGISAAFCRNHEWHIYRFIPFPSMSSDPTGVCTCNTTSGEVNCNYTHYDIFRYPGQTVTLPIVLVSDATASSDFMYIPSVTDGLLQIKLNGESSIMPSVSKCKEWEHKIAINSNSTSLPESIDIIFQVYDPPEPSIERSFNFDNIITLNVTVKPCPLELGFELQDGVCTCSDSITEKKVNAICNISNYQIQKQSQVWI